jgi:hypothetical protein
MVVLEGELVKEMLALIPGEMELFEMLAQPPGVEESTVALEGPFCHMA